MENLFAFLKHLFQPGNLFIVALFAFIIIVLQIDAHEKTVKCKQARAVACYSAPSDGLCTPEAIENICK